MNFIDALAVVLIGSAIATAILYPWLEKYTDEKWDW